MSPRQGKAPESSAILKVLPRTPLNSPVKCTESSAILKILPRTPLNRPVKCTETSIALESFLADFTVVPPPVSSTARPGKNTRNDDQYSYDEISYPVQEWPEFSLSSCIAKFGTVLKETRVYEPPVDITPQKGDEDKALVSEDCVTDFTGRSLSVQVNRALRACNYRLSDRRGHAVKNQNADRVGVLSPAKEIRLVGDIKVSWKWRASWRSAPKGTADDVEYRQVLSQVYSYMNENDCRWGYVLTDHEFLAVERGDGWGDLRVAKPVAWGESEPWTVAYAAWFLHALAAGDEWKMPRTTKRVEMVAAQLPIGNTGQGQKTVVVPEPAKKTTRTTTSGPRRSERLAARNGRST
jgi:hypothetical protein